ncbi:hypothetical protein ON010_g9529 [Phytophthora cinnamomi]|nr:hypothetical protein ON010_g9529 [Phytophthora cinnamomi]
MFHDSLITVSREDLEQIVMEASAEASERVIAVLGPRLDLISRLDVTLHQGPNIRGDRHVGSRLAATRSLEDEVAAAQPNMGVHDDINLDLAVIRGQLHSAEAARAAAEHSAMKESFKHENTMVFLKQARADPRRRSSVCGSWRLTTSRRWRAFVEPSIQLTREQTEFKAAVASSTAQSKRLHDLLSEERSAKATNTTPGTRAADVEADRVSRAAQSVKIRFAFGATEAFSLVVKPSQSFRQSSGQETSAPAEVPASATRGSRSFSSRRGGSRESSMAAPGDVRISAQDGEHLEAEVDVVESSGSAPAAAGPPAKSTVPASSASGASSSKGKLKQKPKRRWARPQPSAGPPARAVFSVSAAKSSSDSSPVIPSRKSSRVVESSDEDVISSSTLSPPSEQVHVDSGASLEWFPDTGSEAENLVVGSFIVLSAVVPESSSRLELPGSESSGAVQGVDAESKEAPPAPPKTQASHRRRSSVPRQPASSGRTRVVATLSSIPRSDPSSLRPHTVPPPVRGQKPLVRYTKLVVKWALPYIEPPFTLPGALKCWTQMLNPRLPAPLHRDLRILSSPEGIAAFADYKNPDHPWQKLRRRLPSRSCLFDTSEFYPDSKLSQRASPMTRAVETTFSAVVADLEMMDWTTPTKTRTRKGLDTLKAAWTKYVVERNKRSDRLRAKVAPYIWRWGSSKDPGFSEVKSEFMFESNMPGYSREYLPWEPKTVDWLSEVAAMDAAEPWRNGWIDVPEQHPYNTTFVPCNTSAPLFVQMVPYAPTLVVESFQVQQTSGAAGGSEDSGLVGVLARSAVASDPK